MLYNFKQRLLEFYRFPRQEEQPFLSPPESRIHDTDYPERTSDVAAQQRWAIAMAETLHVPGCTCSFCEMHSETDDVAEPTHVNLRSHSRSRARSLPSICSVMEVLYPPAYLDCPFSSLDPPSYSRNKSFGYSGRGNDPEISPLISSTTTAETMSLLCTPDPLAQDPSLTGVPSQGIPPGRVLPAESDPLIIGLYGDVGEEPLPAYSHINERRSRHPTASSVLGPYPPLSALY